MWFLLESDWVDIFKVNIIVYYFLFVVFLLLFEVVVNLDLGYGWLGKSEGRGVVFMMSFCVSMYNVINVDLMSYVISKVVIDYLVKLLVVKFSCFYVCVVGVNFGCKFIMLILKVYSCWSINS